MNSIIGPVLAQDGAYSFSTWTSETGLSQSYAYRRIEDAYYARKAALAGEHRARGRAPVVCATLDAFRAAIAAWAAADGLDRRRPAKCSTQNKNRRPLARPAVFPDELAPVGI